MSDPEISSFESIDASSRSHMDLVLGVADVSPIAEVAQTEEYTVQQESSVWQRSKDFVGRHKGKFVLGAIAASAALTFSANPASEVANDAMEAVPYVAAGVAASEAAFVAGGAMMAVSVGKKIGNPLKIKEKIPEIATAANDSWLFRAGFAVNTIGAFGTAAAVAVGVTQLPVEAYPALSLAAADAALTIAVRKAMITGIRNNRVAPEAASTDSFG